MLEGMTDQERVVAGRYRLTSLLGRGGMGAVWCAHDEVLERTVAIKEVDLPPVGGDEEHEALRQRVLREARTAARLDHPNVVRIFDVAEDAGRPWIVMEVLTGRSLAEEIKASGPLTPERAA
ncbi:MAG: eukaryotic-like serine/threonine-protein kinase, partial [Frankiales bacterium]|nr:eukaryotic-like serine/threonine-protein kinase [Frankiales bacterium]